MALLTAAQLKASREALKAGVNGVSDGDATAAIQEAEDIAYQALGYSVSTAATSVTAIGDGSATLYLPERVKTLTSVDVDDVDLDASSYSTQAGGFTLQRIAGLWTYDTDFILTGTFGYASGDRVWRIATMAVKRLAVLRLQTTKTSGMLAPMGAMLTGYSSEQASFTYFTPTGDTTGDAETDRLLKLIRHPFKGQGLLRSVPIVARDVARPTSSELL